MTNTKKTIFDYMSDEDYSRVNQLVDKATEAKKKAPKAPRAPRGPLTIEQKIKQAEGRKAKLEAKLAALLAAQTDSPAE